MKTYRGNKPRLQWLCMKLPAHISALLRRLCHEDLRSAKSTVEWLIQQEARRRHFYSEEP